MQGTKLLVVQFYGVDGRTPDGEPVLAVDTLGAGTRRARAAVQRRPQHPGTAERRHDSGPLERDGDSKMNAKQPWQTPSQTDRRPTRPTALVREVLARLGRPAPQTAAAELLSPAELVLGPGGGQHRDAGRPVVGRAAAWWSRRKAVITPAARDLLQEQDNRYESSDDTRRARGRQAALVVGVADTTSDPADLLRLRGAAGRRHRAIGKNGAGDRRVPNWPTRWSKTDALGLLLSGQPARRPAAWRIAWPACGRRWLAIGTKLPQAIGNLGPEPAGASIRHDAACFSSDKW